MTSSLNHGKLIKMIEVYETYNRKLLVSRKLTKLKNELLKKHFFFLSQNIKVNVLPETVNGTNRS